ncbi:MAG: DNA-processing protein DprA [Kiloniellales bacterium]|nr:DNA-processing protein DprA [Kiloniellales bacterium]
MAPTIASQVLPPAEKLARLRLARSENVGPITFRQLLERYGSGEAALAALPELARRGGRKRPIRITPAGAAEDEVAALEAFGAALLVLGELGYPPRLAEVEDAPPVLSLLGHRHLTDQPAVAMVGARNASANGRRLAQRLAADLGAAGFAVASGLARGIDAAAHQGALETGTIAVVAGGLDVVYPEENRALYEEIVGRGLVLSEMPPGTVPQSRHFPRRNRLISGLALGVVVVEATLRSGSLITARFALEQGREVFAVPGSPLDPRARGCNRLLRQGAGLVEGAEDVVEVLDRILASPLREPAAVPPAGDRPAARPLADEAETAAARTTVEDLLGPDPVTVDELARAGDLPLPLLQQVLLELELAGRIERHPGQKVALALSPDSPKSSGDSGE